MPITNPTVSVVMSVLNGERFLAEAIESILNQTHRNLEFIVIDDGSIDGSASILDGYARADERMRVYHQENRGLVKALNRGCSQARGRYIARMDPDDISTYDRLRQQIEFLESNPHIGVLGGAVDFIDGSGRRLTSCVNPLTDHDIRQALLQGSAFWHPTVVMRKDIFVSARGYRNVVTGAEDYDLWLRIAERFELANLKSVVLRYRLHSGQTSVRICKRQAESAMAARAAANARKKGKPDPLDSIEDITPAVLTDLGITRRMQQTCFVVAYRWMTRNLFQAGEHAAALTAVQATQGFEWDHADTWIIADFKLLTARVYWFHGRFGRSLAAFIHALTIRPLLLGRPLKKLLCSATRSRRRYAEPETSRL